MALIIGDKKIALSKTVIKNLVDTEELTVTPSTTYQTINVSGNIGGFNPVKVNPVTASIDSNIIAGNIKRGISILGVEGTVVESNTTGLTVIPSATEQTIIPSIPHDGYDSVIVNAVSASVDGNIEPENIKKGIEILGVRGTYRGSSTVNIEELTVTPSTTEQTITASVDIDGFDPVKVSAVTSAIDSNIQASNIKAGVEILGVTGNVIGIDGEEITVTPLTTRQTIIPSITKNAITSAVVEAVTSAIDSNIQASNIKAGVEILGITGNVTELIGGSKSITPMTVEQTITPSQGTNAITSAIVSPVTASIDSNIKATNIKSGVNILGVTGSVEQLNGVTTTITENGTYNPISPYNAFSSVEVNVQSGVSGGIPRETSSTGTYGMPANSFTFSLPDNATDVGSHILYYAFSNCTSLTSIDFSNLTTVSGSYALGSAFSNCTSLTSIDFSNLTTVSGIYALYYALSSCTSLTSVDLSSLITISGTYALSNAFNNCTSLTSVDLSSLITVSGPYALGNAFNDCTSLTSVDLSNLATVSGRYALVGAFSYCTSLITISFSALTSTSFGSYTNQFNNMLSGVTGCTVHFPSNLQSVIGSWSDVTAGFGGTNTTILFDLPATT